MSFPRVCTCCHALHSSWIALPFVGVQFSDVPEEALSLRNCPECGTTMAVPLQDDPATASTIPAPAVEAWFARANEMLGGAA